MGQKYFYAKGIKQNRVLGLKYFEIACFLNFAESCYNIGTIYKNGSGVRMNRKKSKVYMKKACELNHFDACKALRK